MSDLLAGTRSAIAEALYLDLDQVQIHSSVIGDLGAESIDLLDVMFRLEKQFGIKLRQGEIEQRVRGDMSNEEFAVDGVLTPKALARLKEVLPEVDQTLIVPGLGLRDVAGLFTVETFMKMVQRHLHNEVPAARSSGAQSMSMKG